MVDGLHVDGAVDAGVHEAVALGVGRIVGEFWANVVGSLHEGLTMAIAHGAIW